MQLLDAALAFALTMLALATIATILIEIVHRLTLWRARGLRDMLGKFYDSEIKGWVQANLPAVPGGPEKVKQELLDQLMANPMVPEGKRKHLHNLVNVLSTREFLRRLGESEVGRKLKEEMTRKTEEAKKKLEDTVDRLMTRYEEFGAAASALFKRRAQVMSFIAGVVLAFIANVDGVLIFDTFIQDPELRSQVLANKATVMAQWEQVDQGYRGLLEADELPEAGANVEFVVPADPLVVDGVGRIRMRVHERGSGETLSCGTGAVAAALAVRHWAGPSAPTEWRVEVPGGVLGVRVFAAEDGEHAALSGPAELVFDGTLLV